MKTLLLALALLASNTAFSNCKVYVPEHEFYHDHYSIIFDFTKMLAENDFTEVKDESEADYILTIKGEARNGKYFQYANASFTFEDTIRIRMQTIEKSKRCYTQYCTIYDFKNAFQKVNKEFFKGLENCN